MLTHSIALPLCFLFFGKAVAAIDRPVLPRAERHFGLAPAGSTYSGKHLTLSPCVGLALVSAGLTALGLVYEASFGVKILLTGGEDELAATLFAV